MNKRKSRKEEKGLVETEHAASQLLPCSALMEAELLHSSMASSIGNENIGRNVAWDNILCPVSRALSENLMVISGFYPHKIIVRKNSFIPILGRRNQAGD